MINVGIVGFGRYGKKYYNHLLKNQNFKIIKKLRNKKKKNPKFTNNKEKFFSLKNIDLYIIASSTFTHFEYLNKILNKNKHIIVEKPLVKNLYQHHKVEKKIKKLKKIILINHTDLYMDAYSKLKKKIKDIGKIKSVDLVYGKSDPYKLKEIKKTTDLPYFEWFPHPLAIIKDLFIKNNFKFELKEKRAIKNSFLKQDLKVYFYKNNLSIKLTFSNNYKNPKRNLTIYGTKGSLIYKGYQKKKLFLVKKNNRIYLPTNDVDPIKNLLHNFEIKFKQKNPKDDRNLMLATSKKLFQISDKIKL